MLPVECENSLAAGLLLDENGFSFLFLIDFYPLIALPRKAFFSTIFCFSLVFPVFKFVKIDVIFDFFNNQSCIFFSLTLFFSFLNPLYFYGVHRIYVLKWKAELSRRSTFFFLGKRKTRSIAIVITFFFQSTALEIHVGQRSS